jgi:hypothetical protein
MSVTDHHQNRNRGDIKCAEFVKLRKATAGKNDGKEQEAAQEAGWQTAIFACGHDFKPPVAI